MILDRDPEFRETVLFYYLTELGRRADQVSAAELEEWMNHCRNGMTGEKLQQLFHDSSEGVAYRNRPIEPDPPTKIHLEIRGIDFVDPDGNRVVLRGTDQFSAYRRYLDGVDLTPLIEESKELGFNMWRVFMMGSARQNNILELVPSVTPGYYDHLGSFANFLNANGIILLAAVFVDAQDCMPNRDDQLIHWGMVADRLRGTSTLLSGGNEFSKNGFDPTVLPNPGMFWSRGSDQGDRQPVKPYGSFAEFHPRRDLPASLLDSVASPVTLYGWGLNVPLIIDEPIGFAEGDKPGSRSADPRLAWRLARHYSTEAAGAVYHNDSGMRCQPMSTRVLECAQEWVKGMKIN